MQLHSANLAFRLDGRNDQRDSQILITAYPAQWASARPPFRPRERNARIKNNYSPVTGIAQLHTILPGQTQVLAEKLRGVCIALGVKTDFVGLCMLSLQGYEAQMKSWLKDDLYNTKHIPLDITHCQHYSLLEPHSKLLFDFQIQPSIEHGLSTESTFRGGILDDCNPSSNILVFPGVPCLVAHSSSISSSATQTNCC